jgi:hypothetical protein
MKGAKTLGFSTLCFLSKSLFVQCSTNIFILSYSAALLVVVKIERFSDSYFTK